MDGYWFVLDAYQLIAAHNHAIWYKYLIYRFLCLCLFGSNQAVFRIFSPDAFYLETCGKRFLGLIRLLVLEWLTSLLHGKETRDCRLACKLKRPGAPYFTRPGAC